MTRGRIRRLRSLWFRWRAEKFRAKGKRLLADWFEERAREVERQ